MKQKDKRLGMHRNITRRDFVQGASLAAGSMLVPPLAFGAGTDAAASGSSYPPALNGMRGAHPGSFEAAHAAVQGRRWQANASGEDYDLVIVGAGISGLAAAHIYLRDVNENARILVLDNHDDFGGHAKRNEFQAGDRTLLCFGGTMLIEAPRTYPAVSKQLLADLGLDAERYQDYYHQGFLEKNGLSYCSFLDEETFGADYLAKDTFGGAGNIMDSPLPRQTRDELTRLLSDEKDYLAGKSIAERRAILDRLSWREYMQQYGKFGKAGLDYIQKWPPGVWAIGADGLPAWAAWGEGYPGFAGMDLGYEESEEEIVDDSIFQFPDGNATIARMLVRRLVPGVAPGQTMEDIVMAPFDYSQLDKPGSQTRIRLNSTVVDLHHKGGDLEGDLSVTYVNNDSAHEVSASQVIWAGYHAMLPHICQDIPKQQRAALGNCIRAPLVYTNVLIRNWTSLAELGIWRAYCPGSFFQTVLLSRPASIGAYRFPTSPEEPMVLHMQHIPLEQGLPAAEQFRAGRNQLFGLPFETFERNAREQLGRMLGPAGFDPAEDILAITVNRWPHGYAYAVDPDSGEVAWWPEEWDNPQRPWVDARHRVGNIAFAGTDSASNAMSEAAIEEAWRSVQSLSKP